MKVPLSDFIQKMYRALSKCLNKWIKVDSRGSSELVILASQLTKPLKEKSFFSFNLVPENPTRGPQRYRFKARKYKFNHNHNKFNLLVISFLTKAFKMDIDR